MADTFHIQFQDEALAWHDATVNHYVTASCGPAHPTDQSVSAYNSLSNNLAFPTVTMDLLAERFPELTLRVVKRHVVETVETEA